MNANTQTKVARSKNNYNDVQTYQDHVYGVLNFVKQFIKESNAYLNIKNISSILESSALLHDLGKLDKLNQIVLKSPNGKGLPTFHEDAGAAYCIENNLLIQAILIYCHHRGLVNFTDEFAKGENAFRCITKVNKLGYEHTNKFLSEYINEHEKIIPEEIKQYDIEAPNFLDWKMLLSILVDADHSNSAEHSNQYHYHIMDSNPRWEERLLKLDTFIKSKSAIQTSTINEEKRNKLRTEMYYCCRNSKVKDRITQCEAPVGSGKTSAVLAYLLNRAIACNSRKIFIVVPFTNLIEQIIADVRSWLVLEDENPNEIVVGHYHTSVYESNNIKDITTLWNTRIIVTTAVQFFETLAACKTSKLRKVHNLPGSCIFIDEFHANLPLHLWPIAWDWMNYLSNNFECNFTISSGSMIEVWNIKGKEQINSILTKKLRDELFNLENKRILYKINKNNLNLPELSNFVLNTGKYPKVVVMNTVQNAAILAEELSKYVDVLHLSTAMTPIHREKIVRKIRSRLKSDDDFILIATSCIESGMDFSFRTGFREVFNVPSALQIAGRVDRNFTWNDGVLYLFSTLDSKFNKHPDANISSVFDMFEHSGNPCELMERFLKTEKLKLDFTWISQIKRDAHSLNFKYVSDNFKVIPNITETVLVNDYLVSRLKNHEKINWREIQKNSVQLITKKVESLCLPKIEWIDLYYMEEVLYDSTIGVMKYMLDLNRASIYLV